MKTKQPKRSEQKRLRKRNETINVNYMLCCLFCSLFSWNYIYLIGLDIWYYFQLNTSSCQKEMTLIGSFIKTALLKIKIFPKLFTLKSIKNESYFQILFLLTVFFQDIYAVKSLSKKMRFLKEPFKVFWAFEPFPWQWDRLKP